MESGAATRFLHPRVLVLATAASVPGLGTLGGNGDVGSGTSQPSAIPILFKMIASQCDLLSSSNETYQEICNKLQTLQIEVDSTFLGIRLHHANVAQCVDDLLTMSTSTPGLCLLHDLIDSQQLEHDHNSAYEQDSLIALFMRKTLVALQSLSFEANARVTRNLVNFMKGEPNDNPLLPSPHAMVAHVRQVARHVDDANEMNLDMDLNFQQQPQQNHDDHHPPSSAVLCPSPYVAQHQSASITLTTSHYIQHLHALKRRDMTQINDSLHRYFDRALYLFSTSPSSSVSRSYFAATTSTTNSPKNVNPNVVSEPHHYAALALAAAHAQTHPSATSSCAAALDDAVRVGSGIRALIWLAYAEHRLPRRHILLASRPEILSRDLFHTVFTPVSDSFPYTSNQHDLSFQGLKPNIKRFASLAPVIGKRTSNAGEGSTFVHHDDLADDNDKRTRLDDLLLLAALKLEQADFSSALANVKIAMRCCRHSPTLYKRASDALSLISIRQQHLSYDNQNDDLVKALNLQIDKTTCFNTSAHANWCELIQSVRSGYGRKCQSHARALSALSLSSQSSGDILLDAHEAHVLSQQSFDESFHLCHARLLRSAAGNHRCARYVRAQLLCVDSLLESRTLCFALRVCLGAVSVAHALGLSSFCIEACVYLADCLGRQPNIAIGILQPLLHRMHGCDPSVYARALRVWAEAQCHEGNLRTFEQCQKNVLQAISIYSRLDDLHALARCSYLMARLWHSKLEHLMKHGRSNRDKDTDVVQHAKQMRNRWSKRFRRTVAVINMRRI